MILIDQKMSKNLINIKKDFYKKVITPSDEELDLHKKFLKSNLKKIILVKFLSIQFFKINFFIESNIRNPRIFNNI